MSLWNSMPLAKTVASLITAIFDIWPFFNDLDPKLWVNFEWTLYIYFEHCEFKKKLKMYVQHQWFWQNINEGVRINCQDLQSFGCKKDICLFFSLNNCI